MSGDGGHTATVRHSVGCDHASGSGSNRGWLFSEESKHAHFFAQRSRTSRMTIALADETVFVGDNVPYTWKSKEGSPKQLEIVIFLGVAEMNDDDCYTIERGIAKTLYASQGAAAFLSF